MEEGITDLEFTVRFKVHAENQLSYNIYIPGSFSSLVNFIQMKFDSPTDE